MAVIYYLIHYYITFFTKTIEVKKIPDPLEWNWLDETGPRIGVVLYRALFQANDTKLGEELCKKLRK